MGKSMSLKNIFADKASFVPRMMLADRQAKWVVRDFTGQKGISLGMAQEVLSAMEKKGYVERVKRGPDSYAVLTNPQKLIDDWIKEYSFEQNVVETYYSPDRGILRKIADYLKEGRYALTLHTGANLFTSFVRTDEVFLYVDLASWRGEILEMRQRLDLKELVRGGNIHFIRPFYKNTVFFNAQKVKGFCVVSNLQLYLDLYNFQPRGKEHAEYLKGMLEERGKHLE